MNKVVYQELSSTSPNSGHTATLRSAQIWQSRTSYVRRTLSAIEHKGFDKNE